QYGVTAAVAIEYVEFARTQDAANARHAAYKVVRPVHQSRVDREAFFAQALREHGMRLTDRFHMMTALSHGQHHAQNVLLLSAKTGCCLRVQNAQPLHEYCISTLSGSVQAASCSNMVSAIRTLHSWPSRSVQR